MLRGGLSIAAALVLLLGRSAGAREIPDIEYERIGGTGVCLDAWEPDGPAPFPIAIVVHGGGWGSGDKEKDITPLLEPLRTGGFTVFTINYRLAPAFRWPDCYDDLKAAIRWAKSHGPQYRGDPARIALIGYSAGGQLVCLAAVQASGDDAVAAVVGLSPPTDLTLDLPQRGGLSVALQHLLNRPHLLTSDARQQLCAMSAINFVRPGLPPFLLLHGTADKSVLYQDSLNFQARLQAAGDRCDLIPLPGAPHNISLWGKVDPDYPQQIVRWLRQTLQPSTTQPTSQPAQTH